MDSIFMRLNFSSLLSSITAELCSTSWGVWQEAPLSPLCFLCLLTCSFEPCRTYKHRSFVERTSGCFNLWQNGHTGTLMANHMITWGETRHEHAHSLTHTYTRTHTHTHTSILLLSNEKHVSPRRQFFMSWEKLVSSYFCCYFNEVLRAVLYNFLNLKTSFLSLCQIIKITKTGVNMFPPYNNNTHTHTHTHTNTSTDRSPSFSFFNYIFRPQQLDLFCLFGCAGASWDSIYTHTHPNIHWYHVNYWGIDMTGSYNR